jgi:hypothetical protein
VAHLIDRSDFLGARKRNGDFRKNYGLLAGAYLYTVSPKGRVGALVPADEYLTAISRSIEHHD